MHLLLLPQQRLLMLCVIQDAAAAGRLKSAAYLKLLWAVIAKGVLFMTLFALVRTSLENALHCAKLLVLFLQ